MRALRTIRTKRNPVTHYSRPRPKRPLAQPARGKGESKIDRVITVLERAEGATLDELVEVTGWLSHTTRAALTGLKKGYTIERDKVDGVSRYKIVGNVSENAGESAGE